MYCQDSILTNGNKNMLGSLTGFLNLPNGSETHISKICESATTPLYTANHTNITEQLNMTGGDA